MLAFAILIVAASPPQPAGSFQYVCQASARWGEYHSAVITQLVDPQYGGLMDADYQISWSKYGKGVAELIVRWTIKDRSITSLSDPRSLYFDFPLETRLRGGTVFLVSPSETISIVAKKPAVHFIGGHFHDEAVEVVETQALHRLVRGGPWRFVAVDGHGRLAAEGPLNMPAWEEMARRFAVLNATLDKLVAAPDGACQVIPVNEEEL